MAPIAKGIAHSVKVEIYENSEKFNAQRHALCALAIPRNPQPVTRTPQPATRNAHPVTRITS